MREQTKHSANIPDPLSAYLGVPEPAPFKPVPFTKTPNPDQFDLLAKMEREQEQTIIKMAAQVVMANHGSLRQLCEAMDSLEGAFMVYDPAAIGIGGSFDDAGDTRLPV